MDTVFRKVATIMNKLLGLDLNGYLFMTLQDK